MAVLDYINASMSTDADYKVLSKGIATVLAGRLGETESIRIVTREKLQEIIAEQTLGTSGRVDASQAVQVGKLLNAHHMIYGTYLVQPNGDTRITASAYSVETSEMEFSTQVRGSADKIQDLIDQLGDKLATGMKLPAARAKTGRECEHRRPRRARDPLEGHRCRRSQSARRGHSALQDVPGEGATDRLLRAA